MAFAPSGKQVAYGTEDGGVWLWDLQADPKAEPRKLGQFVRGDHPGSDYVRLVRYVPQKGWLLAVGNNGQVLLWTATALSKGAEPQNWFKFHTPLLYRVA